MLHICYSFPYLSEFIFQEMEKQMRNGLNHRGLEKLMKLRKQIEMSLEKNRPHTSPRSVQPRAVKLTTIENEGPER